MRLWYLSLRRPAKAQASLRILALSLEHSLFAHMKYGNRQRVRPKIRHLAPTGWLRMRIWRMSLRRTKSAIISWAGSFGLLDGTQRKLESLISCTYLCSVDLVLRDEFSRFLVCVFRFLIFIFKNVIGLGRGDRCLESARKRLPFPHSYTMVYILHYFITLSSPSLRSHTASIITCMCRYQRPW